METDSGAGLTFSVNVRLAAAELESVTVATNAAIPAVVGVPDTTPADDRARPGGSAPRLSDQEYGEAPPVATMVCEYCTPTTPEGSGEELATLNGVMTSVNVWLGL